MKTPGLFEMLAVIAAYAVMLVLGLTGCYVVAVIVEHLTGINHG